MANSQPSCSNLIMLQPLRKDNTDINSVSAKQIKPIMYASRFEHLSRHISSVSISNTTAFYVIVTARSRGILSFVPIHYGQLCN